MPRYKSRRNGRHVRRLFHEELADSRRNLRGVGLQGEMSGVEEAHNRVRNVALERLSPLRQEKRVVLAPRCQEGRLVGTEILLEAGVERHVALVIPEQVELHFGGSGSAQVEG